jgi:hypothetical protein
MLSEEVLLLVAAIVSLDIAVSDNSWLQWWRDARQIRGGIRAARSHNYVVIASVSLEYLHWRREIRLRSLLRSLLRRGSPLGLSPEVTPQYLTSSPTKFSNKAQGRLAVDRNGCGGEFQEDLRRGKSFQQNGQCTNRAA